MNGIFSYCSSLKKLNLNNFNTTNVTNMGGMFYDCSSLKELNLNNFNTNNVNNMSYMFDGCSSLKELNLNNFNTNNVTDMSYMFYELPFGTFTPTVTSGISRIFLFKIIGALTSALKICLIFNGALP